MGDTTVEKTWAAALSASVAATTAAATTTTTATPSGNVVSWRDHGREDLDNCIALPGHDLGDTTTTTSGKSSVAGPRQ